jgi:hypothetical protein
MRLKVLSDGFWQVIAPLDANDSCSVEVELASLASDRKLRASVIGLRAVWGRIPTLGPRRLGTPLYHCVDEDNGIYEFIKGPLRLLCFEASGRLVVCSHTLRKTTRKTPRSDKALAIALKKRYLAAVTAGEVKIVVDNRRKI